MVRPRIVPVNPGRLLLSVSLLLLPASLTSAQTRSPDLQPTLAQSPRLEKLTRDIVTAAVDKFGTGGRSAGKIGLPYRLNAARSPYWQPRGRRRSTPQRRKFLPRAAMTEESGALNNSGARRADARLILTHKRATHSS